MLCSIVRTLQAHRRRPRRSSLFFTMFMLTGLHFGSSHPSHCSDLWKGSPPAHTHKHTERNIWYYADAYKQECTHMHTNTQLPMKPYVVPVLAKCLQYLNNITTCPAICFVCIHWDNHFYCPWFLVNLGLKLFSWHSCNAVPWCIAPTSVCHVNLMWFLNAV